MDAAPSPRGTGEKARRRQGEDIGEGNAGWRVATGASLGERGMTANVRPDREIRHTSDAPPRYPPLVRVPTGDNVSGCCLHFRALSSPDLRANYRKDFDLLIRRETGAQNVREGN